MEEPSAPPLARLLSFDVGGDDWQGDAKAGLAAHGYDVLVRVVQASNLPSNDWWNGLSDPYIVARLVAPDGTHIQYRTRTAFRDLNPTFDEFFEAANVPQHGCRLEVEVWDKDLLTRDDMLGTASWGFDPLQPQQQAQQQQVVAPPEAAIQQPLRAHFEQQQAAQAAPTAGTSGRAALSLQLYHPRRGPGGEGRVELEVQWQPAAAPGPLRMLGPVRFRQQLSPMSGLMMWRWNDDSSMAFSTYKLFLCHIGEHFAGVACHWNRRYPNAQKIFSNPVLLSGVRSQHAALYATQLGRSRFGVLRDAADLFSLFNGGARAGQRRYFTYSLLPGSLRCSETGATFAADMMSKHAMHAGGAEEVLFAGEFCIVPDAAARGGYRLVIDNNSGTYAPPDAHLPRMRALLLANFPGMAVDTLAAGDPRLEEFHRACPSRLKAAAAQAAAGQA